MRTFLGQMTALVLAATVAAACDDSGHPGENVSDSLYAIPSQTASITSDGSVLHGASPEAGDIDGLRPGVTVRGVISFDLATIPAGKIVKTARIRLFQSGVAGTPYQEHGAVILDHILTGGTLDPADFQNDALDPGFAILSADSLRGLRVANVFQQVQADLAAGRTISQFRLRFSIMDGDNDGISDNASFNNVADFPPPLIILTYED